jgi:tyrosyl-tRNA synthetase
VSGVATDRPTPKEQADILCEGCDHVERRGDLEARLAAKPRLSVKFGIDPTGSELHLGHAVVLHKMQQFIELGHRVVLLIGDFTARIGDPTGRNDLRPHLTGDEIEANMASYREQAARVLDIERTEIAYNSEWLAKLTMIDLIRLMSQTTVAQMLARNDFANRYAEGTPIALHEFLYPVAQAYDSIAMQNDVELGGTEQLFNLLLAREYQRHAGQPEQICMTTPILEGTDGIVRMGKSRGNYIGLSEPAADQFGKLMSIPDEAMPRYALLAAFRTQSDVDRLSTEIRSGAVHAMDAKKQLAEEIVTLYHGPGAAREARDRFERTHQKREIPSDMPENTVGSARTLADVLVRTGLAASKREAERLVAGGGIKLDGVAATDPKSAWNATAAVVLSSGTRRFVRVLPNPEHP